MMQQMNIRFLAIALIIPFALVAGDKRIEMGQGFQPKIEIEDGIWIKIKNSSIYIYDDYDNILLMKVTHDYDLLFKGNKINMNPDQQTMVQNFYHKTFEVTEKTKIIAKEGAKIGMRGAGLGLKAVLSVAKLLLPTYDSDDLERDMDEAAARLELKAEKLEEKADSLDQHLDELEDLYDSLHEMLPDTSEWEWI